MQSQTKIVPDGSLCVQKVERWQEYDIFGKVCHHKRVERYQNGKRHGNLDVFVGGKIHVSTPYLDGKRHGKERTWFSNGKLASVTFYVDDKEHGIHRTYDVDGTLAWCLTFIHGKIVDGEEKWESNKEKIGDSER